MLKHILCIAVSHIMVVIVSELLDTILNSQVAVLSDDKLLALPESHEDLPVITTSSLVYMVGDG
jgi:hypothetical protein